MNKKWGYTLDFSWEHDWPKSPIPDTEQKRLDTLDRYQILHTPKDGKLDRCCTRACEIMKCPIAGISFINEHSQWYKSSIGLVKTSIDRDISFCAHTIMNPKDVLEVCDATKDVRFVHNPLVTSSSSKIRYYCGIPLVADNGQAIGTLFVLDRKTHLNGSDIVGYQRIAKTIMHLIQLPLQKTIHKISNNAELTVPQEVIKQRNVDSLLLQLLTQTTETQQTLANHQTIILSAMDNQDDKINRLTERLTLLEDSI